MKNLIIRLHSRGKRYLKKYDIVVTKLTGSPSSSPISKIGYYDPNVNNTNKYSIIKLNLILFNYWVKKKIKIHSNVLKILKFKL